MKKALIIGINTYAPQKPLRGCLNDAEEMRALTTEVFAYDDVLVLPEAGLTKQIIIDRLRDLLQSVPGEQDGARLFYFAGHGGRVFDVTEGGDEVDRIDENICLALYVSTKASTYILDDEFAEILADAAALAPFLRTYIILDSCHSGTATRADTRTWLDVEADLFATFNRPTTFNLRWLPDDPRLELLAVARQADDPPELAELLERSNANDITLSNFGPKATAEPTTHLLLSGCSAQQTCKDVPLDGSHHGIFTYTLTRLARSNPALTWLELRDAVHGLVQDGFQQTPQLEGSLAMKTATIFQ